jgi:hypothetical protein
MFPLILWHNSPAVYLVKIGEKWLLLAFMVQSDSVLHIWEYSPVSVLDTIAVASGQLKYIPRTVTGLDVE